jgi:hypothetical protein
MYTDEPVPEKDVAPGQNFSRFNLLTKITAFPLLGYPTLDVCQDSRRRCPSPKDAHFLQRFTQEKDIAGADRNRWTGPGTGKSGPVMKQ